VRDHDHGTPLGTRERHEHFEYGSRRRAIETSGGFVGKQDGWIGVQRSRDGDALTLSSGEDPGVGISAACKADRFEQGRGAFTIDPATDSAGQRHVVQRLEFRQEVRILEHQTHAFGTLPRQRAGCVRVNGEVSPPHLSRGGGVEARKQVQ